MKILNFTISRFNDMVVVGVADHGYYLTSSHLTIIDAEALIASLQGRIDAIKASPVTYTQPANPARLKGEVLA